MAVGATPLAVESESAEVDMATPREPLGDPVLLALLNAPEDDEETIADDIADLEATRHRCSGTGYPMRIGRP